MTALGDHDSQSAIDEVVVKTEERLRRPLAVSHSRSRMPRQATSPMYACNRSGWEAVKDSFLIPVRFELMPYWTELTLTQASTCRWFRELCGHVLDHSGYRVIVATHR